MLGNYECVDQARLERSQQSKSRHSTRADMAGNQISIHELEGKQRIFIVNPKTEFVFFLSVPPALPRQSKWICALCLCTSEE